MSSLHYISILAGGSCPKGCHFCVGRGIRDEEQPPHFADIHLITDFLEAMRERTDEFSISGSTSDPLYLDKESYENVLIPIIIYAKQLGYRVSLHTVVVSRKKFDDLFYFNVDEICVSIHDYDEAKAEIINSYAPQYRDRFRISSVCHNGNRAIFETPAFFELYDVSRFTIRRNIFDPDMPDPVIPFYRLYAKTDFGQKWYLTPKEQVIALWDFTKANEHINALYLWSDGRIKQQCYWYTIHELSE